MVEIKIESLKRVYRVTIGNRYEAVIEVDDQLDEHTLRLLVDKDVKVSQLVSSLETTKLISWREINQPPVRQPPVNQQIKPVEEEVEPLVPPPISGRKKIMMKMKGKFTRTDYLSELRKIYGNRYKITDTLGYSDLEKAEKIDKIIERAGKRETDEKGHFALTYRVKRPEHSARKVKVIEPPHKEETVEHNTDKMLEMLHA